MGSAAGKNVDRETNRNAVGSYRRQAYHAGSWYEDDEFSLNQTLQGYLVDAERDMTSSSKSTITGNLRAVIVPHAGYRYSGPTAAYSYYALRQALSTNNPPIEHILVLHPAHHVYLKGCAVSGATVLETPLGDLPVAGQLRKEILALSPNFSVVDAGTDNEEHSGEMQYPYLAKILLSPQHKDKHVSVLPIMCGALSNQQEESFGKLLAPIIARPNVVCVISSDFCHWGSRFRFTSNSDSMPIHQFIRELDHQGMDLIAAMKPGAFAEYLQRTRNTICGRHAISVWLQATAAARQQEQQDGTAGNSVESQSESRQPGELTVNFVKYDQSSAVESMSDSSVSYASAVVTTLPTK